MENHRSNPFEPFFKDLIQNSTGRKIAIWGAGFVGKELLRLMLQSGITPSCFVDKNAHTKKIGLDITLPVIAPTELTKEYFVIIASEQYEKEIEKEIQQIGFAQADYACFYSSLLNNPVFSKEDNHKISDFHDNAALIQRELYHETICHSIPDKELTLETSARCNSKCIMCSPHGMNGFLCGKEFDFDRIDFLMAATQKLTLNALGEPLIGNSLWEGLKKADEYEGIESCCIHTNGILLNKEIVLALLHSKLGFLSISIDAATPKMYMRIRGVDCFDKVIENVRQMIALRNETGSEKPEISINATLMRENLPEIPKFIELAASLGVDCVLLRPVDYVLDERDLSGKTIKREGFTYNLEQQTLTFYPRMTKEIIEQAKEAAAKNNVRLLFYGSFVNPLAEEFADMEYPLDIDAFYARLKPLKESMLKKMRQSDTAGSEAYTPLPMEQKCEAPWREATVGMDGRLAMCCYMGHMPLGNLQFNTFFDVWNCSKAQQIRRDIIDGILPEACYMTNCPFKLDAVSKIQISI